MVNVSGLQRRSTYEEVAKLAELDEFRNLIKTPDRLPKTIIDAPSMTALEGGAEHEEALVQFEKNKRVEEARRAQVVEVAQERGVSRAQLELATRPGRPQLLEPTADYERQRWEISLANAAANFSAQSARAQNLENIRTQWRDHFMQVYRERAEQNFAQRSDPVFYDLTTPPNEVSSADERNADDTQDSADGTAIDLHFPDAPRSESFRTAAGHLARMAGGAAATGGMEVASAASMAAPLVARTIHSAGPQAINLLTGAARITRDYGPTVLSGTAAGAGMLARGMVTTGQIAAGTISAAAELAQALAPASHRGRDFMGANGARWAPALHRLMAEHHGNMF
jgi:hypothetical protein